MHKPMFTASAQPRGTRAQGSTQEAELRESAALPCAAGHEPSPSHARRAFVLRAVVCAPAWSGPLLSVPTTSGGAIAALALAAPQAARGSEPVALDTAPFFTAAVARAVGGSMVAAEWRGDYAAAARLTNDALEQARRSGSADKLCDALCSRAAVASLAGNAGQAQGLLEEARRNAGDDPLRRAWVEAYEYAAYVRRYQLLPGGTSSSSAELGRHVRPRLPPSDRPEAPGMGWIRTEYFVAPMVRYSVLHVLMPQVRARNSSADLESRHAMMFEDAPAAMRQRAMTVRADAVRRSGRRDDALVLLSGVRATYAEAKDWPGVLATEVLEGDWFAAPATTPEELNLFGLESVTPPLEALELDLRHVDADRANRAYQRAEERARALKSPRALAALQLRRAMLARSANNLADAEQGARQAMAAFDACGDRTGYWTSRWHAALASAANGRPATDDGLAQALGQWGRNEGSYSQAWGLGLIAERAARQALVRTGSPEAALAIHQLTEALYRHLGAWLQLWQAATLRSGLLGALGDKVGAMAAMLEADHALDRRLAEHRGPLSFELSLALRGHSVAMLYAATVSQQPDAFQVAADQVSHYASRLRADADDLRRSGDRVKDAISLESSAGKLEEDIRPVPAHIAALWGMKFLREGNAREAEKHFRVVEANAAGVASGLARTTLDSLVFVINRARRHYPAAAAAVKSGFDVGGDAEQQFKNGAIQMRPELANHPAMLHTVWSQLVRRQRQLSFAMLVSVRSFDGAAEQQTLLEQLAGADWWRESQQPWIERADCARLQAGLGRMAQAADMYREAIDLLENRRSGLRADVLKVSLASQRAVALIYLDAAQNALQRMVPAPDAATRRQLGDLAFEYIERVKARGLLDLLGGERPQWNAQAASAVGDQREFVSMLRDWQHSRTRVATWQALQLLDRQAGAAGGPQAFLEQKIAEESARMAQLDQDLARLAPDAQKARTQGRLLSPAQVAVLLPPRSVLLQMAVLEDDLLLCAVSASGEVIWHQGPVDAIGLKGDMRRLRFLFEHTGAQHEIDMRAQRIAKALLDPFDNIIAAHEQIIIVPHGPAYAVPFGALPWRGAPLAERRAVSQIPSASVLPFLLRTAPAAGSRMLSIGNPARMAYRSPLNAQAQPKEALPGAEAEARAVAAGYPGSTVLVGGSATAAAVRNALPGHHILHLATHGVLSEAAPMLSSMLLADGEALTLDDFMALHLDVELAVLSACNTGNGNEDDGNDVLGFTRGLLVAGARSAVVSLWPVDDASTRLLMERFYAELRRGHTSAAALRTAQMALRAMSEPGSSTAGDAGSSYSHPHFWAAFVLVG